MGIFDNIFSSLDGVLKDIEEGGLEKKLDNLANMIDKGTKQVVTTTDKFASAPEKMLKTVEAKKDQIEKRVVDIRTQTTKTMDMIRPKGS